MDGLGSKHILTAINYFVKVTNERILPIPYPPTGLRNDAMHGMARARQFMSALSSPTRTLPPSTTPQKSNFFFYYACDVTTAAQPQLMASHNHPRVTKGQA